MLCINFEHGPCFCVNKTPNVTADTIKTIIGENEYNSKESFSRLYLVKS